MPLTRKRVKGQKKVKRKELATAEPLEQPEVSAKAKKAVSCLRWVPRVGSHLPYTDAGPHAHSMEEDEQQTNEKEAADVDSDDSEHELKDTDYVIICGRANEVRCQYSLEMMVYDSETDLQFLKHDILLARPPLDLTWMDFTPQGDRGSFAIVCSLLPFIEIFDLTQKKECRAALTLGGCQDEDMNLEDLSPEELKQNLKQGSHSDAVLCVDWNISQRNILASGSADHTLKVWDLMTGDCAQTLTQHSSEVLQVEWHPSNRFQLLSAGMGDQSVILHQVGQKNEHKTWNLNCRADTVSWHPQHEHCFLVGTSEGDIRAYETRMHSPLATFKVHPGHDVSCLEVNRHIHGLLATASSDKSIAMWDIRDMNNVKPVCRETLGVGEVYCLNFNPNNPVLLAAGGSSAKQLVWTVSSAIAQCGFTLPS